MRTFLGSTEEAERPDPRATVATARSDSEGAPMQRDELLTVDQVLDELAVARRTFARWRSLGRAPQCIKLPNGELRIWRSELQSWLGAHVESAS